jgi:hypothetical protein
MHVCKALTAISYLGQSDGKVGVLMAKMSVDSVEGARVWKSFAISHLERGNGMARTTKGTMMLRRRGIKAECKVHTITRMTPVNGRQSYGFDGWCPYHARTV